MINWCPSLQQTGRSLLWLLWLARGSRGVCSWAFPSGTCVFLLLPRIMGAPGNWPISNHFFFSSLSPLAQFVKAQKALQANCGHYRSFQSLCFCRPKKWPGQWAEWDSCWRLFLGTASFAGSVLIQAVITKSQTGESFLKGEFGFACVFPSFSYFKMREVENTHWLLAHFTCLQPKRYMKSLIS